MIKWQMNNASETEQMSDLKQWTTISSGASLSKIFIGRMIKSREIGKRVRSISHHASLMPNTSSASEKPTSYQASPSNTSNAFTQNEKANLVNRFLPNQWTLITTMDSELFRCLHLPNETFVTLAKDKWLRFYVRKQSEYELKNTIRLPDKEGLVTDLTRSTRGDQLAYTASNAYLYHSYINQIDHDSNWNVFHTPPLPPVRGWEAYFSVRYTLDDKYLIVGGAGGYFCAHQNDVKAIHCSKADPHLFCSGSSDGCCKLWDDRALNNNTPLAISAGNGYSISHIDGDSYNKYIVTTSIGGTIAVWDLRRFSENLPLNVHQKESHEEIPRFNTALKIKGGNTLEIFWQAKISPERTGHRYIYCGSDSGCVYVFDIVSGQSTYSFRKCYIGIHDCSWHPTDNEIISVSLRGATARWYYKEKGTSINR
ncbi:conserved hypothetical protein [Brugia malayi]|uniref:Uncharacterized protein n=1 Tax=Brugia malayi TaxID=6279 RepID=A0A4E9F7X3_BRUMA|nr:uncharacterized protein BM_BM9699 [Brugia malayi]VIO92924.1 conserved hypothetical protein [Brugia malayi]